MNYLLKSHADRFRERIQRQKGQNWRANMAIMDAGKTVAWWNLCTRDWPKLGLKARQSMKEATGLTPEKLDEYWESTR